MADPAHSDSDSSITDWSLVDLQGDLEVSVIILLICYAMYLIDKLCYYILTYSSTKNVNTHVCGMVHCITH